jgi:histidinol-phosphate aminotransferase
MRSDISELEAYTPVKPLEVLSKEIGIPIHDLCKLDANEVRLSPNMEFFAPSSVPEFNPSTSTHIGSRVKPIDTLRCT